MRKISLLVAAALVVAAIPAMAHDQQTDHSRMQHYGGHGRHMHRDWSGIGGRGHVHSVCWEWDAMQGWEWVCR